MIEQRVETAALLLRVALGGVMLAHGLAKIFVFTLPGTAAFFESVGYPGFAAYPVVVAEVVGGLAMVVGLHTRWAALAMVPILAGATLVHIGNGWMFTAPNGGWEFPAYLVLAALAQFLLGTDGALSLGRVRRRPIASPELEPAR